MQQRGDMRGSWGGMWVHVRGLHWLTQKVVDGCQDDQVRTETLLIPKREKGYVKV